MSEGFVRGSNGPGFVYGLPSGQVCGRERKCIVQIVPSGHVHRPNRPIRVQAFANEFADAISDAISDASADTISDASADTISDAGADACADARADCCADAQPDACADAEPDA